MIRAIDSEDSLYLPRGDDALTAGGGRGRADLLDGGLADRPEDLSQPPRQLTAAVPSAYSCSAAGLQLQYRRLTAAARSQTGVVSCTDRHDCVAQRHRPAGRPGQLLHHLPAKEMSMQGIRALIAPAFIIGPPTTHLLACRGVDPAVQKLCPELIPPPLLLTEGHTQNPEC